MFTDIVELRDFYQNPLGQMAKQVLQHQLAHLWPETRGEQILLLGYGAPLLRPLSQQAGGLYSFMPAPQGVSYWPREGPNVSALVDIANLPLADNSIDRVIALHALESVADPGIMLREIWRVMKSGGRLLAIVPNRRGLWAHSDRTPFGNGQPYSASQIKRALHHQGFLIERIAHALYALPSASRINLSVADSAEKYASYLFPGLGGVLLLEASKQLYAPMLVKTGLRHRLVLPLPGAGVAPLPT